jgi:hypothetical protein
MVFRTDLKKTLTRVLLSELVDLTEDEVSELADSLVQAVELEHDIVEDYPDLDDTDEEEEDFIDDDMSAGQDG